MWKRHNSEALVSFHGLFIEDVLYIRDTKTTAEKVLEII
jgi:hypothetical protein